MNAQQIAAQGRYGDNTLVHASANEVKGLDALSRSIYGQNLPRNPQTGLPEAFLFAPFLAPLLAGGLGVTGAIGTGLLAGGLGAAEAAARGMDDPLQQGLLAGLTGGAAAGIGGALANAGTQAGTQAATQAGTGAATLGAGASQLSPQALAASTKAVAPLTTAGVTPMATSIAAPSAGNVAAQTAQAASPGFMQGVTQTAQGIPQTFSQMGRGAKALMQPGAFAEGGVGQTFMQQAKVPAIAGGVGLMGQSALAEEQRMSDLAEEREREREEAYNRSQAMMQSRVLPMYNVGSPFAEGGIVNLARGGFMSGRNYDEQNSEYAFGNRFGQSRFKNATPTGPDPGRPNPAVMVGRSPQFRAFMSELQKGAGAPAASQASGYTGGRYASEIPKEEKKMAGGGYLDGGAVPGDGMSDSQPAMIDGQQPAALSSGEFVVPADVVSGLGNGSSDAGAQQLYAMMDRIRKARTGTTEQAPKVNPNRMMVA